MDWAFRLRYFFEDSLILADQTPIRDTDTAWAALNGVVSMGLGLQDCGNWTGLYPGIHAGRESGREEDENKESLCLYGFKGEY